MNRGKILTNVKYEYEKIQHLDPIERVTSFDITTICTTVETESGIVFECSKKKHDREMLSYNIYRNELNVVERSESSYLNPLCELSDLLNQLDSCNEISDFMFEFKQNNPGLNNNNII